MVLCCILPEMEAKGWNFDPDSHIFIGRRCRRFFKARKKEGEISANLLDFVKEKM